ncbi:TonB-dependent receptor [Steroidobacter sp.]|uniref:TonB-dependent receptor n=1 Tax=Steroidobacter sp. TaxID=1978227 RepID=UPI001A511163|nr:TonB-dependent receptor [Steroidobacter sp.]MBL8269825.1 TonB-dependent receptor [Steroidobacter sp.]
MHRISSYSLLAACVVAAPLHAADLDREVAFSIPAQPLDQALVQFSHQADVQIVTAGAQTQNLRTRGASGTLSISKALASLLRDSGLSFKPIGNSAISVGRFDSADSPPPNQTKAVSTAASYTRLAQAPVASSASVANATTRPDAGVEEVIVTGSNIVSSLDAQKRGAPVQVITDAEIDKTGANTLADVLASNPSVTGGMQAEQGSGGRGFVNMRGLGTQYTLVLVNGRRLSANDPANILAIPADAVARVEVLKSGASAVYGSDAVAGVVNVILKSSSDGIHASATYGGATQGGGEVVDVNLFGGFENDDSRFFFLANYMTREEITVGQRDITASSDMRRLGGFDARNSIGSPGRIVGVTGSPALIADPTLVPRGTYSLDPTDYRPYVAATDLFDINAVSNPSLIPNPRRTTLLGNFEHDFFDGAATFFASGLYFEMHENMWRAPLGLSFSSIGAIPATNPYNPFGQALSNVSYRPLELGRQLDENTATTRRLSAGVRTELGTWQLESAVSWYRSNIGRQSHDYFVASRLRDAVNRTGPTAFNPFCNACNTPEQYAGVLGIRTFDIGFDSDMLDVRASGGLFDLPTGTVYAAIGGEYRREQVDVQRDPLWQVGGWAGISATLPYDLSRDIYSVFAELRVPLLAPAEGSDVSPLELSLAGRHEDYSDFGTTATPMATLRYSTLQDQLTLRASYAEAFLAPYLEYSNDNYRVSSDRVLVDPLTGGPIEALVHSTGTSKVKPETSKTVNVGAVFTPDAVSGLMVSLDYFRIQQEDFVPGTTDPQRVLNGTANGIVTRGVDIGPAGQDVIVETFYYNAGRRRSSGYELSVHYALPSFAIGRFNVDVALTRMASFEVENASGQLVDIAGSYDPSAGTFFSTGALPKTRGLLGLSWELGAWSASSQYSFMSGYNDLSTGGTRIDREIPFYATADFQVSYAFGQDGQPTPWLPTRAMKVTLGVENAFDRDVPFLVVRNGYNSFENDIRGRFVYGRVSLDF